MSTTALTLATETVGLLLQIDDTTQQSDRYTLKTSDILLASEWPAWRVVLWYGCRVTIFKKFYENHVTYLDDFVQMKII